jgi:RHS repeat-associated protein
VSGTDTCVYNANDQLTSDTSGGGTTNYLYDPNGSLTNIANGTTAISGFTYDLAHKLNSVTSGSQQVAYRYDDDGSRVESTAGTTTHYLIDPNNHTGYAQILEELPTAGGTPTMSYVIGNEVLAQGSGLPTPTVSYFLQDGHGSNRQLAQMNGTVSYNYSYDAFGNVQSAISSSTANNAVQNGITSKLYSGEQYDSNLQMYNLRARYYDPANGRFNQRDSVEGNTDDPITLHRYLYANCDPVNVIDPSGNQGLLLDVLTAISITCTMVSIAASAIQIVNNLQALNELITINLLLNSIDEIEPEFLLAFANYAFFQAVEILGVIANAALSICKEIVSAFSGAVSWMFFIKDTFLSDNNADGDTGGDAAVAQDTDEMNSQNSLSWCKAGKAWEIAEKLAVHGVVRPAKQIIVNGSKRFPDDIDEALGILTEYKSVKNLRFSKQLRDYLQYSLQSGYRMQIRFNPRVKGLHISSFIWDLHNQGFLDLIPLP